MQTASIRYIAAILTGYHYKIITKMALNRNLSLKIMYLLLTVPYAFPDEENEMDLGLRNKRALVTGGTRGIGRAIVECLVGEGCIVDFCARNRDTIDATVAACGSDRVHGEAVDVQRPAELRDWVIRSGQRMGGIDIVISNVSAIADDWQAMLETDILAAINLIETSLPFLRNSSHGSIIAISSRAAYSGGGAYPTMKCALISLIKGYADTLAAQGIRANVVSPGDIYFEGGFWHRIEQQHPGVWAEAQKQNKMGRMGRPDEVARVVAFVVSPAASYISGANIRVDGASSTSTQF